MARIKKRTSLLAALVLCAAVVVSAQIVSNLLAGNFTVTSTDNMVTLAFDVDPSGPVIYGANVDFDLLIDSANPAAVSGELIVYIDIPTGFDETDVHVWKMTAIPAEFAVNATGHASIPMTLQPLESKVLPMRLIFGADTGWQPDSDWSVELSYHLV